MAGTHITISPQGFEQATNLFQELAKRGNNLEPAMAAIGEYLVGSNQDRIVAGVDDEGKAFTPLSKVTNERKTKNKDKVLIENGYLFNLVYQATADAMQMGTDRVQGAMLYYGGTRDKYPSLWGDIPARHFIGISPDDRDEVMAIINDYLSDAERA
ncbi:phage virion morphogenesis protein [Gallaecimonas xiamenensis]|uniref:Phage virion morphogenesis protein n=1 Tax=Gallaecimonas xiamenensis 3-C-1 TaxID=745411 RepID=K2JY37_9GAMM|nr:phage virion morphogenesis protein [Gallaecimonas xiamenensis]EKE75194.1 phage virion morphogenesis protein [Gallaecimonas xiamenensis 3-C-1]